MIALDNPLRLFPGILHVPGMRPNLIDLVPCLGLYVQDLADQVLGEPCDIPWDLVLPSQDFVVQELRILVLVFKREVPGEKREEDDPRGPKVDTETMVAFTGNHLRGGVAGRATGRYEELFLLVEIAKPEVNDLDVVVRVKQ